MSTSETQQTPAQIRLAEMRAEVARLQQDTTPVDTAPIKLPTPGETVHCLVSGTTIATGGHYGGAVLQRGQNLTITQAMLEASRDRHGRYSGPALAYDELTQYERYGDVLFRPGPAPLDLESWKYGDADWAAAREQARAEAHALPTADARAAALRAVIERFGAPPVTSTTLNSAPNASIRAAEEQQERIRAKGVVSYQNVTAREAGAER